MTQQQSAKYAVAFRITFLLHLSLSPSPSSCKYIIRLVEHPHMSWPKFSFPALSGSQNAGPSAPSNEDEPPSEEHQQPKHNEPNDPSHRETPSIHPALFGNNNPGNRLTSRPSSDRSRSPSHPSRRPRSSPSGHPAAESRPPSESLSPSASRPPTRSESSEPPSRASSDKPESSHSDPPIQRRHSNRKKEKKERPPPKNPPRWSYKRPTTSKGRLRETYGEKVKIRKRSSNLKVKHKAGCIYPVVYSTKA